MEKKGQSKKGAELQRERKVLEKLREAPLRIEWPRSEGKQQTKSQAARASAIRTILNSMDRAQ